MWNGRKVSPRCFFCTCFLMIFSALTYDGYRSYSQLNLQFSNDNITIEQALQHIPTCTPKDRHRQRVLLNALQAWAHLAEKHNLEYWLAYGSLVGYVQRGGLLPHDADVDVIMMTNSIPNLLNVSQSNFSSKYEIKVHPQWYFVGDSNRSYFRKQGINFVAPNARLFDKKTRAHIDIFPAYNFNPLQSNKATGNLTIYDLRYKWLSHPKNWTYPLRRCSFSEIKVLCPAEPEKLVASIYGGSAVTKSDTKCANGAGSVLIEMRTNKRISNL